MKVRNRCLEIEDFFKERVEVLKGWPTGKGVDLEEACAYHKEQPPGRAMVNALEAARRDGATLIQPRGGVAIPDKHIELLRYLRREGEADILPTTIDSYTRQNQYREAEKGIRESEELGRSMLNGFPAVNHGVEICRRVIEALDVPLEVRHGTPDARLLAEITLAGGFSDFEGGGISYNIPYAKNTPLENTIAYWQYVDRLVGYYYQQGVKINREPFGPLTGTLIPPSISHSIGIIEALLAAEQGVKSLSLGYGQNGNLLQDVAAVLTLENLAGDYLKKYGYDDVQVTTVFHQWMGGFPQDEAKAFAVISWGAAAAALSKVCKVIVKTPYEAMGIPGKEANAQGLRTTRQIINMLKDQKLEQSRELDREKEIICRETGEILGRVLELGEGDWARGTVTAFAEGILDIPFAPSKYNAGKVLPARDNKGAVRFLDFGELPFGNEVREFNRDKLAERGKVEEREVGFQMVIDDIYAISKGMLVGRPR